MEEQNIQEKNIVGVGRMTAGFILRVIGYTIVFAIIWGIIGDPLARGLASILMNFSYEIVAVIMKIITPIIAFGGGLFIQYFVCKWSTESLFRKNTLEAEKVQTFYRNVIIYFFACVAFALIPSPKMSVLDYILSNVIPSLLYIVMIPIQKKFIEKQIEGADIKINNKVIAIVFIVLIGLGYATTYVVKSQEEILMDMLIDNSPKDEVSLEDKLNRTDENGYSYTGRYVYGLARASKDGKWGYIDRSKQEAIPFIYESADDFYNEKAIVKKDGKYGMIDLFGDEIFPFIYENLYREGDRVGTGEKFESHIIFAQKNGKWGALDKNGKDLIPFIYEDEGCLSNGLIAFKKDGKWGYIDKEGKEVIPFIYDDYGDFDESGVAILDKGDKWLKVDTKGNVLGEI